MSAVETTPPGWENPSERQQDVLRLIALGLTGKQIADWLCVSYDTVIKHRLRISAKLGISGPSSLLCFAFRHQSWLTQTLPPRPADKRLLQKNHKPL